MKAEQIPKVGSAFNRKRTSQIIFRRLLKWTKKELDIAKANAKQLAKGINWD